MLIAQLTDLHVGPRGRLLHGIVDTEALLARAVDALLVFRPRPDLVLVSGDLVDAGLDEEYRLVRDQLDRLPMPVYAVPGNHDRREGFRAAFADRPWARAHPRFIQYALEAAPLRILALDTLVPGEVHGELCPDRLDWLERELAGARLRRVGVLAMLGGSVFAVILLSFRRVSVPLRQIAAAVARLSRGELGLVLPGLGRGDEIGGIARALEAFRVQSLEVDRLRRLQERASLEDRLRIRAAVDSSADAVVIGGIDGQTLYVNPAARKLLGVPADTLPCLRRIVRRLRPAGQARALARTMRHRGA